MHLLIFITVLGVVAAEDGVCYSEVLAACRFGDASEINNCHSRYGEMQAAEFGLQSFVNKHITHSFQFLLLSSHFNNYEKNREGFRKLFKTLSDETWKQAIDLIKYITKRGGRMVFNNYRQDDALVQSAIHNREQYELYELESLAKAMDIEKSMANEANRIHLLASRDSETMSHIENAFVHQLSARIRTLSGHANDLRNITATTKQPSLYIHLFDNYLQKLY